MPIQTLPFFPVKYKTLFPGKYYQILLDLLTIRPWRDHGSDQNAPGTLVTDLFFVILYF